MSRFLFLALAGTLLSTPPAAGQQTDCPETHLCVKDYCTLCYDPYETKCKDQVYESVSEGIWLKEFDVADDYCDCCGETYIPYIKKGGSCLTSTDSFPQAVCGPGLVCSSLHDDTCQRPDTDCTRAQDKYDESVDSGTLGMDESRPVCDEDGYWSPVQCSFAGVCRCVDKNDGSPIFGFAENLDAANKTGMDCRCAREVELLRSMACSMEVSYHGNQEIHRARFEEEYTACIERDEIAFFSGHLRCLPNGNYDPAQCIEQVVEPSATSNYEETCFCLDSQLEVNGSIASISTAHIVLPCHMPDEYHFKNYYRPCEAEKLGLKKQMELAQEKDRVYLSPKWDGLCSPDGFYALIQKDSENATIGFCSDKLGDPIPTDEGGQYRGLAVEMDCLCAQARTAISALDERPVCVETGSYRKFQCRFGRCYCVNKYGQQQGEEEDYLIFNPDKCPDFSAKTTSPVLSLKF